MPELKRNFLKGRMNKDLDERIVPGGEYRHALNVEVGTSEGGDSDGSPTNVGSLQTIMGNEQLSNLPFSGTCVGSIADEKNDTLYWFVASNGMDIIVRYDQRTGSIDPVIVDLYSSSGNPKVLNFFSNNIITGINIVDDMLFWTDNQSEPKKINIPKSLSGSGGFLQQTTYVIDDPINPGNLFNTGIPIQEKHITVIKENPVTAPVLEMKNTAFTDKVIEGQIIGSPDGDFTDSTGAPLTLGDIKNSVDMLGNPDFKEGDILLLTSTGVIPEKTIRVKVDNVVTPQSVFDLEIIAIHTLVGTTDINWEVKLEQRESFFDFKFPRFAIRYKYDDGEYSAFGPFSEVAFLPGEYDYQPKKGFNLGMVNQVRHLAIKDFVPEEDLLPNGVIAIDILYKESNSPNVYTVKTVKSDDVEWNTYRDPLQLNPLLPTIHDPLRVSTKGFLEIESEMIHAVLPSNQSLRPWDNVPRKALAQEITGNRLVYGNYLQNYDVKNSGLSVYIETWRRASGYLPEEILPEEYESYLPAKSIKSLRTYQLGVVFRDKYGRETPVFSDTAKQQLPSVYVEKKYADRQNHLVATLTEPPPPFADSFKFYIKETSNEYYNLAMDRWYDAQDDNIWLSFPSSERNKVDIDTFLILKKARDSSDFVADPARYKILAIENEAPRFVKTEKHSHGSISNNAAKTIFGDSSGTGFPLETYTFIYVAQTPWTDNKWDDTLSATSNPLWVRMRSGSSISQWYRISSISHDTNVNCYKLKLKKPLETDMSFTSTNNSYATAVANLKLEIMEEKVVDKPEFEGRFFVKVYKDITLMNNIVKATGAEDIWIIQQAKSVQYCSWEHAQEPDSSINNASPGWHNATSGSHRIPKRWSNAWEYLCTGNTCIMGQQGVDYPSFFNSAQYSAFSRVSGDSNNSGGRLDRLYLLYSANYEARAAGTTDSVRYDAEKFWQKFDDESSGWFIDGWLGLATSGSWKDCDPQSGGGADLDVFPRWSWKRQYNGHGIVLGSNRIELSFHRAGKRGNLSETQFDNGWWSEKSNKGMPGIHDYMSLAHADTASELLFKESLVTPGTLWRWGNDPDQIVYETTADEDHSVYFNYSMPCWGQDGTTWAGTPISKQWNTIEDWDYSMNRRQRFRFKAKVHQDPNGVATWNLGGGKYGYLPTNDPRFACIEVNDELVCFPHLMWDGNGAPASPTINGVAFTAGDDVNLVNGATNCSNAQDFNPDQRAPGIRSDGMPSGYDLSSGRTIGSAGEYAGTVTWQIVEPSSVEVESLPPTNPAVWETEPKEDVGLDIYYEVGQVYPTILSEKSNEQYIPIGSVVECWRPGGAGATIVLGNGPSWVTPIRVAGHDDNEIFLVDATGAPFINNQSFPNEHILPGDKLKFRRADGSATAAEVISANGDKYNLKQEVWDQTMRLPWFNCYSFGNGIESDRIRDDFNQVTIDNGPKASTTLDEPYLEERRSSGFIWSGIYNSISGVNNLNQFIQAEPITKDLNPSYGSIQKIFSRNTDLVTFCEDKVLKVQANKDALFNADGNTNITATDKVLGQTIPFAGEFGISKNPESFANEAYRLYFSDISRGVTCRLSQNGITPISEAGMQDWFADRLPAASKVVGSFDDKKQEYNVTLTTGKTQIKEFTLSFSETSKGWTSFKSFIPENGISFNNNYYTFKDGQLYQHHINETRNEFYNIQYDSSVNILFNDIPGSVKSFNTLNYEGTQSRITLDLNDPDYYNNTNKTGWYVNSMYTNLQEINEDIEFKSKEGKWFAQVKGEVTTLGNLDTREFSVQGIGNSNFVGCPSCPTNWICIPGTPGVPAVPPQMYVPAVPPTPYIPAISGSPAIPAIPAIPAVPAVPPTAYIPAIPAMDNCSTYPEVNHGLGSPTQVQFLKWISDTANGHTNTNLVGKKVCVSSSYYVNEPDSCLCDGGNGVYMYSFGISYINNFGNSNTVVGPSGMNSWNTFIAGLQATGDPVFTGLVNTMNYDALLVLMQNNINSQGLNQCDYGYATPNYGCGLTSPNPSAGVCGCGTMVPAVPATSGSPAIPAIPGTPAVPAGSPIPAILATPGSPAIPATPGSPGILGTPCLCVETYTPGGKPTKAACENDITNCCGLVSVYGCTDPMASNYDPTANVDDGSCIYPSWECSGANGVSLLNGTLISPWTCFDPGTGNGSYSSVTLCQNACTSPVSSWDCISGTCVDPGNGNGFYSSLASCQANCTVITTPSWDCVSGTCIDPGNGNGVYSSLTACQATCTTGPTPSWECSGQYGVSLLNGTLIAPWTCYDPGTGTGSYTTLATCNASCSAPVIVYPPCRLVENANFSSSLLLNSPGVDLSSAMQLSNPIISGWKTNNFYGTGNNIGTSIPPYINGSGNLVLEGSQSTGGSSNETLGIYQRINNLVSGQQYTLTVEIVSITPGVFSNQSLFLGVAPGSGNLFTTNPGPNAVYWNNLFGIHTLVAPLQVGTYTYTGTAIGNAPFDTEILSLWMYVEDNAQIEIGYICIEPSS